MTDRRTAPLMLGLLLPLAIAASAQADHVGKIEWQGPQDGFERARQSGRAVMLYFSADW